MASKTYYKSGEVSEMLGIPIYTLRYWEKEFAGLNPSRVNNQRRYTPADIEVVKRIKELLYERKYRIEAVKEAMSGYRKCPPRRTPKCTTSEDAINLLQEVTKMTDNEHLLVRIEAVERWIIQTGSQT